MVAVHTRRPVPPALDDERRPDGCRSVGRSLAIAAGALLLAVLLDAEALEKTASSQPFGWKRDLAMDVMDPVADLSRLLHLNAPRRFLEDTFDRPAERIEQPSPPAIEPSTPTTPTVTEPPSTATTPSTSSPPTTAPARRTPTSAAPLRLLVAGDSMSEAAGPSLLDSADATGVIRGTHELRYSSGLTRPDYFDWPGALARFLDERDPEAVIIMVGANDAQGIQTPTGPASFGTEAWAAEYRSRVRAVMSLLGAEDRTVYWVGLPVMRSGDFDDRMRTISEIYRSEASRHRSVRFIDTRPLFADEHGTYAAYLPNAAGDPVLVRREDGIHLTPAGADRLARHLMQVIGDDWEIG